MRIDLALFSFFSTILLQWVIWGRIGSLTIKPFHIAMLIMLGNVLLNRNALSYMRVLIRVGFYFFLVVFAYLIVGIISLAWANNIHYGLSFLLKQSIYAFLSIALAIKIMDLPLEKTSNSLFWGGMMAFIVLVVQVEVLSNDGGTGFLDAYWAALSTGNLKKMIVIFAKFFNMRGEDVELSASLRHVIIGLMIISAFIVKMSSTVIKTHFFQKFIIQKSIIFILENLLYFFVVLSTIFSMSRSSWLVGILMLTVAIVIKVIRGGIKKKSIIWLVVVFSFSISFVYYFISSIPLVDILNKRIFYDTGAYNARLIQYNDAINFINRNIFIGGGLGKKSDVDDFHIHNFFLRSWYESGLIGFIIAIWLYLVLFLFWANTLKRIVLRPKYWVIEVPPELVMALPVIPLTSVFFSAAFQGLLEWTSVGVFFGLVLANARKRRMIQNSIF